MNSKTYSDSGVHAIICEYAAEHVSKATQHPFQISGALLAPEVYLGKERTFASDVYTIGMLLWMLIAKKSDLYGVFPDMKMYEIAKAVCDGTRPNITAE